MIVLRDLSPRIPLKSEAGLPKKGFLKQGSASDHSLIPSLPERNLRNLSPLVLLALTFISLLPSLLNLDFVPSPPPWNKATTLAPCVEEITHVLVTRAEPYRNYGKVNPKRCLPFPIFIRKLKTFKHMQDGQALGPHHRGRHKTLESTPSDRVQSLRLFRERL